MRTSRQAKRSCWRRFCDTIGRPTPVGEVRRMIKRMSGVRREWDYPVLTRGKDVAVTEEKAEMMAKAFVQVYSLANLSEEGKRGASWSAGEEGGWK